MRKYITMGAALVLAACVSEGGAPGTISPTAPYSTAEYDATTLLPCSLDDDTHDQSCAAGIQRGEIGFASITTTRPDGVVRVLEFGPNDVSTPEEDEALTWGKDGDTWYIGIDNYEFYAVPDAAIYGG